MATLTTPTFTTKPVIRGLVVVLSGAISLALCAPVSAHMIKSNIKFE